MNALKKPVKYILFCTALICCTLLLSGCHVFAWYIPVEYSESEKEEIYAYIRDELLSKPQNYIAGVGFNDGDGYRSVTVWSCDGKLIMNFTSFSEEGEATGEGVWYDGVMKQWDYSSRTETVTEKPLSELNCVFENINRFAEYMKSVVGTPYPDGYFHKCFPWPMGMAQIYYTPVNGTEIADPSVSAFWTVQNTGARVSEANFDYSTKNEYIKLEIYSEPYNIDERIENILGNYGQYKTPPEEENE